MKKITLLVQEKDVDDALNRLRDLAAVHVEHQGELKGEKLNELKERLERYENAKATLIIQNVKMDQAESGDIDARIKLINDRQAKIKELGDLNTALDAKISYWQDWGNFEPEHVRHLEDKGIYISLAELQEADKAKLPDHVAIQTVSKKGKLERCVLISREKEKLPVSVVHLPEDGLELMTTTRKRQQAEINDLEIKLKENTRYLDHIGKEIDQLSEALELEQAARGMVVDSSISVLNGFCPEDKIIDLEATSKDAQWGLIVEDPTDSDEVPTQLKNPKWVELSTPTLKLIEILPGYKEVDVSAVFLIFFTLFFGILIGDAAYGAIFAGLTLFAQIKLKDKVKDKTPFILMYLLTGFTCLWGVLTGTYFGQQWLPSSIGAVVPWLNDTGNVQWLCFTIALVHLGLARLWSSIIRFPNITFLSEIGWFCIVVGMYFLANMFVLNQPFPQWAMYLLFSGIGLALLFMIPFNDKKYFSKLGQEIIPFVLGVIGAGTDIISYIRLFAVGLATVAVADAANAMPEQLPGAGYVFMVFLHVLNLILAAMAILVHAIRLNVLEFSGHLGLEWVGKKYNPFKKLINSNS